MSSVAKVQDFVAHASAITDLRISKKSGRIIVTAGGEDRKVNLWAIGKTSAILSLSGHSSSVESVAIDWPEEIVVAGSSSGTVKLWDLEHSKVIRTLTGHKSSVGSVEFHPFGEFFASGSADAVVKIWDVRKKGCIQTYTGHQDSVTELKITPDGRWIATGGADGMVKIWDMTAGKPLKTFTCPGFKVASMVFNPSEFMVAVGTTDKVVRFYDLQNFELISSTPPLTSSPRCLDFSPEGQELIVCTSDSLQIWTWEPIKCHESISINWPNIYDIRALEDRHLCGASVDHNFVGVWGVDMTCVKPYGTEIVPGSGLKSQRSDSSETSRPVETPVHTQISGVQRVEIEDTPLVLLPAHVSASNLLAKAESFSSPKPTPVLPAIAKSAPRKSKSSSSLVNEQAENDKAISLSKNVGNSVHYDISSFVQESSKWPTITNNAPTSASPTESNSATSPTSESDVIDALSFRHISVISILTSRLASIKAVRAAWDDDGGANVKAAVETLANCRDTAVWIDVIRVINLKPKLLTLEIAVLLLPLLNELLFEVYEEYVVIFV